MGWGNSDYGDRLIEVTLRDDAWTALFDPRSEPRWRVVDADGEPVSERAVARHPGRVAAVYHVAGSHVADSHVANRARAYREVVLVNEAQIERWTYATESIRARVRTDAERLRALADHFEFDAPETGEDFGQWLEAGWLGEGDASLASRYRSCLSLSSEAYVPTPAHLRAIAAAIDPLPDDEALEHTGPPPRARPPQPALQTYSDPTMGCYP